MLQKDYICKPLLEEIPKEDRLSYAESFAYQNCEIDKELQNVMKGYLSYEQGTY